MAFKPFTWPHRHVQPHAQSPHAQTHISARPASAPSARSPPSQLGAWVNAVPSAWKAASGPSLSSGPVWSLDSFSLRPLPYSFTERFWVFQGLALFLGHALPEEEKTIVNIYWAFTTCQVIEVYTTRTPHASGHCLTEWGKQIWMVSLPNSHKLLTRYSTEPTWDSNSGLGDTAAPFLILSDLSGLSASITQPRVNTQSMHVTGMITPSWNFPLASTRLEETI